MVIKKEQEIAEKYAKIKGLKLNPDKKEKDIILEGLAANRKTYGVPYCPCRILTGNTQEDAKKICPCFWHLDEIKKDGHCLCRLFWSKKEK